VLFLRSGLFSGPLPDRPPPPRMLPDGSSSRMPGEVLCEAAVAHIMMIRFPRPAFRTPLVCRGPETERLHLPRTGTLKPVGLWFISGPAVRLGAFGLERVA